MKMQNKSIIASILFVLISFVCHAQGVTPPPPSPPPPPGLPIDGAVWVAMSLGLIYGSRRLFQKVK